MNGEPRERILHIGLLGGFRLVYGDEGVTTIDAPRLRSLLAYLLLNRDAPQLRHRLAFLFWPDSPDDQALTNLRNLLYHFRHNLPDVARFVHIDRESLFWRSDAPFECDLVSFEEALTRADHASSATVVREELERAVSLYRGDLLPGSYDDWIAPERQRLRQAFTGALERLIRLLEDRRDYRAAIDHARRLVRHDPLREDSYRRLMRLQALIGDRAGALRTYHRCAALLERELDVEPGPAIRDIYERLLAVEGVPAVPRVRPRRLRALSPLVGRHAAWTQLRHAWRRATAGAPHLVLISGEAGIGKTRLAEELVQWADRQGIPTAAARCYAAGGDLAYAPVAAWLRTRPLPPLPDVWRTEVARIVPEVLADQSGLPAPGPIVESWQRRRFFEALAHAVLGWDQPLLLFIDALQWCDPGTLEWLQYLLHFDPRARFLLLGAYRPDSVEEDHPLSSLLHAQRQDDGVTEIQLPPLSRSETATLAASVADRELGPDLVDCLYRETEGNPLFIVETVRGGLPEEVRKLPSGGTVCSPRPLPSRMKDALVSRVVQLSPLARSLAELAATIGREFTFDVLREASDAGETRLVQGLDELWRHGIVREQGEEAYDFSHDKLREVLVEEMSEARRHLLHRRVGAALEHVYGDDLSAVAARIAAHYERAGEPQEAIPYYRRAAEAARRVKADQEVARCLQCAAALEDLPASRQP